MLKMTIPPVRDETLFEITLEPIDSEVEELVKRKDVGETIDVKGKINRVTVGIPYYENLISRYIEKGEEISHEINQMKDNYDFHFVNLSCSFLPDRDCKFAWVRFTVELTAKSESGELYEEKPIAWDMAPDEINSMISYKREVGLSPEIKLTLGIVDVATEFIDFKAQKELIVYEPQITAYGVKTSSPIWDFESTEEKELRGNKKDLILIVKAPKNSKLKGRFSFNTEIEYKVGIRKWIPIFCSVKKDNVVINAEYDLS